MYKRIIFLDFDGVISLEKDEYSLNNEKMNLIKEICDRTDSRIVVSSSWRLGSKNIEDFIESITNTELGFVTNPFTIPEYIVGMTPFITEGGYVHKSKGSSIDEYLYENPGIENYVILDDEERDFYSDQRVFLVKTDPEKGVSSEDVEKSCKLLTLSLEDKLIMTSETNVFEIKEVLNIIKDVRDQYRMRDPREEDFPKDELVLCRMKSNGALVSGFLFKDESSGKYKVATPPDFEFEDYMDYECDGWFPIRLIKNM